MGFSMQRLRRLVGHERSLREVSQTLHFDTQGLAAPAAGAVHVTCADESERECVEAFQQGFVQHRLPPLKFASRSALRLANLGGRYEWGAVRIAEAHFATAVSTRHFKLMVVKLNAHVALEERPAAPGSHVEPAGRPFRLGTWTRYGTQSACCGALHALLQGHHGPFADDLREAFRSEGQDRIATLQNESRVHPAYRPLLAAVVAARIQARKVVLDIQDYAPVSPTFYLVLPCVTINRHEQDTEIVCGLYTIDGREGSREATYFGLGDDPGDYVVVVRNRLMVLTDPHVGTERAGRDHRRLTREQWKRASPGKLAPVRDPRLDRIREDVARSRHRQQKHARALLRAALPVVAEVAPVPAAILMFTEGAAGIHHAFRVHRLARELQGSDEAREILDEIHERVDHLDADHAAALIEILMKEYGG